MSSIIFTNYYRRIDFTIETSKYQIGIEMKIDADDEVAQLFDYLQEMQLRKRNNQNEAKVYYLTLDGKYAAQKSLYKEGTTFPTTTKRIPYTRISFYNDILNWLEKCIREVENTLIVRELLIQYKYLIQT